MSTSDDLLSRLDKSLSFQSQDQVIVISGESKLLSKLLPESPTIEGSELFEAENLSAFFEQLKDHKTVKILFSESDLTARNCGILNQQREQLRRPEALLLLCIPLNCEGVIARSAPDLWHWATIIRSERKDIPALPKLIDGYATVVDEGFYAAPLKPGSVSGPTHKPAYSGLEEFEDE